ncbi:MAG: DUF3301 domain-containing protein [Pseudomonadales bacterium]|nr:DUF3301 domain-containing protein [Pseudomonadales bacterium]
MSLSLSHIIILLACFATAMYFFSELHVREIALNAARSHSDELNVQLLDQSVGIHRVWFKRGSDNRLHIWRNYQFEFTSTGDERYKGHVITLGEQVETVQLQAHRVPINKESINKEPIIKEPSNKDYNA